ncbi:VWA domain-containing protein [Marixanthomonas ophiurae]|uniref:VWA domain-containing protein n=1 Tax=Marixanthomonas ophiurae TaxID=387659 RepID=A0A3E1Q844_9FLAO|nr:VWA domain-containing protein [Marixanthomonas ophiurae]RFN58292.1 VWA domain-containing protein [Marixanthomonas ophiurae]
MTTETIVYIIIAGVISFALALFMYGYKTKYSKSLSWIFGILRFITLFSLLLLLINPKFKSETYSIEKPKLPVLVDNSVSIAELNQTDQVSVLLEKLKNNENLNEKFDLSFFSFGSDFEELDSLSFSKKNSNLTKALEATDNLFKNENAPTILVTDGNQTLGSDYEFTSATYKNAIYPFILGDSTTYTDLKIERLNSNRYAFLKNKFPVEVILVYNGTGSVTSQFIISHGGATVFRETISFSENTNSKTLNFTLPASNVGLQKYTAQIVPLEDEKNKTNNNKQFAVEVIDQATNVLVVSDIIHPDLGALKKSITANEQRTLTIKKPSEATSILNEYQLVVLFQPDRSFTQVYSEIKNLKKNTLTITGTNTDWNFLNSIQQEFKKETSLQTEEVSATLNNNYGTFAVEHIGFNDFPPLKTTFGDLSVLVPHEILLGQSINGFETGAPMLATLELNGKRDAVWDGEGFWKWRAQLYLQSDTFQEFDVFMGKLVQYLASNKRRSRLEVSNETFYYNNNSIKILAQYFDKNFVFDSRAALNISVRNVETETQTVFPMLLRNNFYEVDLNSLPAGEYKYTVSVADESISRSGNFTILDFNVEQQFLNADFSKLIRVAQNTNGTAYFPSEVDRMIEGLIADDSYQSVQKSELKTVPLIDWKYLLALIVLTLSAEWFIRKYNGLI